VQRSLKFGRKNLIAVNEKLEELQRIKESLLTMATSCQTCCPSAKAPDCTIEEALSN
jgi:hypothetical protein